MMRYIFLLVFIIIFHRIGFMQVENVDVIILKQNDKFVQILEDPIVEILDSQVRQHPMPQVATRIKIDKAKSFVLSNGLKVFVVQKPQDDFISIGLQLIRLPETELDIMGIFAMTKELMTFSTQNKSREKLDIELENLSAHFCETDDIIKLKFGKAQQQKSIEILANLIVYPNFNAENLEVLKAKKSSDLSLSLTNPIFELSHISKVITFGKTHPWSSLLTRESIQSISLNDCKNFYKKNINPNTCYLTIIGDVDLEEIKNNLEVFFSAWKQEEPLNRLINYAPILPQRTNMVIVDNGNSKQAHINIVHAIPVAYNHPDMLKLLVLNMVLGGNTSSRLFNNFIEQKAYAPYIESKIEFSNIGSFFYTQTVVKNNTIDTAIKEILLEMHAIQNENILWQEIVAAKNFLMGEFIASLEKAETIIEFAIQTDKYKLPADYFQTYLHNLNRVSIKDVHDVAIKYLKPEKANIILVGNKIEIIKKTKHIKQIPYKVLDMYGNNDEENIDKNLLELNAKSIIKNYIKAIGGRVRFKKIDNIKISQETIEQDQKVLIVKTKKIPNKYSLIVKIGDVNVQEIIFNESNAIEKNLQGVRIIKGREFDLLQNDVYINPELLYDSNYTLLTLKGVEKINNQMTFVVEVVNGKKRRTVYEYFNVITNLKTRTLIPASSNISNRYQIIDYDEYKEFDGLLFPTKINIQTQNSSTLMSVNSVEINKEINDAIFDVNL